MKHAQQNASWDVDMAAPSTQRCTGKQTSTINGQPKYETQLPHLQANTKLTPNFQNSFV